MPPFSLQKSALFGWTLFTFVFFCILGHQVTIIHTHFLLNSNKLQGLSVSASQRHFRDSLRLMIDVSPCVFLNFGNSPRLKILSNL